jgi:hypothetical protein
VLGYVCNIFDTAAYDVFLLIHAIHFLYSLNSDTGC